MLVHPDSAGQHARADVAGAHHLEKPLDGAIFTKRSMQQSQRNVDRTEMGESGLITYRQFTTARDTHQHGLGCVLAEFGQFAVGHAQPADGLGINQYPAPGARDPDADHIKAIPIQGTQYPGGGQTGHAVLAAGSAEDHCDSVGEPLAPRMLGWISLTILDLIRVEAHAGSLQTWPVTNQPQPPKRPRSNPLRPETVAVTAGRPERVVDAPLNPPVVFASTLSGRTTQALPTRVRPLRQPDLAGAGASDRRSGGRPSAERLRDGRSTPCWS